VQGSQFSTHLLPQPVAARRRSSWSATCARPRERELARESGSAIVYNLITSRAVREIIRENGGVPVRGRLGHPIMKQLMAEHGVIVDQERGLRGALLPEAVEMTPVVVVQAVVPDSKPGLPSSCAAGQVPPPPPPPPLPVELKALTPLGVPRPVGPSQPVPI
jgi:hypothetical protein